MVLKGLDHLGSFLVEIEVHSLKLMLVLGRGDVQRSRPRIKGAGLEFRDMAYTRLTVPTLISRLCKRDKSPAKHILCMSNVSATM